MAPPSRPVPPPLEADVGRVALAGAACWAVALVALAVADLAGVRVPGWWLVMCACGVALGVAGSPYSRRRTAREDGGGADGA